LACQVDDLADGESLRVEPPAGGAPAVAVHRVEGGFYATDDLCTHEDWSLGEDGDLEGYDIVCCLHQAAFDVRTGEVTQFPATTPLKTYPVRVADGAVWVELG
jgi:nitrite reductase/ring-hydroxylating ferredoxin subunit